MSDAIPLPPRPNLEQYRKLAKDLQHACRSTDAAAVVVWAARWLETLARLQGVETTPEARSQADREAKRIEQRWHRARNTNRRVGCLLADAQFFVAREHGFASWTRFVRHVEGLARSSSPVSSFETAADAIVSGDTPTLQRLLRDRPELVRERSTREHHSTLLHYVSANGVEDFRQKTPKNIVDVTRILLAAGADVNAESDAYGGGSTTLGLVATSIHPEQAGVQIALLQTLLDHGARMDQPAAGGNAQSVISGCLANGQPGAAEFLVSRGAALDLEGAAALGRLAIVKSYFDEGALPRRRPTRQQIESAFLYACGYGRKEVVDFLLDQGVDHRSHDVTGGLHWATYGEHVEIVRRLLDRGWPVHAKEESLQATPLELALHVWAHTQDAEGRERGYEVVGLLVGAGAKLDPQWFDGDQDRRATATRIRSDPRMLAIVRGSDPGLTPV